MGPAIAALLWGDVNPSRQADPHVPGRDGRPADGRLPAQYPGVFTETGTSTPPVPRATPSGRSSYTEGLKVGYRWYDGRASQPLFPFGFGLSYTSFEYSGLSIRRTGDGGFNVAFTARNTGPRAGADVPQVYLGPSPNAPASVQQAVRKLAGFKRIELEPGQSQKVQIHVTRLSLSYWSVANDAWVIGTGSRSLGVGSSSRDVLLAGTAVVN